MRLFFDPPISPRESPRKSHRRKQELSGTTLAATKRRLFCCNRSNHCLSKRLKPEQQTGSLRPQYVGTKKLYRSATRPTSKLTANPPLPRCAMTNSGRTYSVPDMNDVTTETKAAKAFDPEAFAMNLARAMETQRPGARGLSEAAREWRGPGQAAQRTRRGHQDIHRRGRVLAVGQRAIGGTADEDGQGLSGSLGFGDAPPCRRTGAAGDRALAARQAFQGSRMEIEPVFRFRDAGLSADDAVGAAIWCATPKASIRTPARRPSSTSSRSPTRWRRRISFSPIRKYCARRWPPTATTSFAA